MSTKKKLTNAEITKELVYLERLTNALNTAVVAMSYVLKVKGNELDDVDIDDYLKFVSDNLHPLVRKADEIAAAVAKRELENAKEEEK